MLIRHSNHPVLIAVDANGGRTQVDAEALSQWRGAPLSRIEAGLPSPALRRIEILDLPGAAHPTHDIGDLPLKASRNAHIAIWCTSATQAWKGSEVRSWLALPERLRRYSLLAATHKDRLRVEADCEKVYLRLRKEAAPFFRNVVLFSSLKAKQGRDGALNIVEPELWRDSGADVFQAKLADAVMALAASREQAAAKVAQRVALRLLKQLETSGFDRRVRADGGVVGARRSHGCPHRTRERQGHGRASRGGEGDSGLWSQRAGALVEAPGLERIERPAGGPVPLRSRDDRGRHRRFAAPGRCEARARRFAAVAWRTERRALDPGVSGGRVERPAGGRQAASAAADRGGQGGLNSPVASSRRSPLHGSPCAAVPSGPKPVHLGAMGIIRDKLRILP